LDPALAVVEVLPVVAAAEPSDSVVSWLTGPWVEEGLLSAAGVERVERIWRVLQVDIRVAQTSFILFSTFLYLRPVSAASDSHRWTYGVLEIRISNSKTPV
jgi:hypothetical protein